MLHSKCLLFCFAVATIMHLVVAQSAVGQSFETKPLKIYILAGQSNMEGHAHARVLDYLGDDPATASLLKKIKADDGGYRKIKNTWVSYLTGVNGRIDRGNQEVVGQLTVGFGNQGGREPSQLGEKLGPELAFGITMQEALDQPILIIKTAWGGQSLHTDYRSPSSGPYKETESNAKRFDSAEKRQQIKDKTGRRYHQMIEHVRHVLADLPRVCPEYDAKQGYELAGFVWFQGFNDMVDRSTYPDREQPGGYALYAQWLANFIRDVRMDLKAPDLPFVIGVMGVGGPIQPGEEAKRASHREFRAAMSAPASMPEFKGNVVAVATAPYWDPALAEIDSKRQQMRSKGNSLHKKHPKHENADGQLTPSEINQILDDFEEELFSEEELALEVRGKSNAGYHYLGSAKTYSQIGVAFAQALLGMGEN
jgi:alpha-galactosidase